MRTEAAVGARSGRGTLRSVVGSVFGFSAASLALGLRDNAAGRLTFVDPSHSMLRDGPFNTIGGTAQWSDAGKVAQHFARFGVADLVTHHRMRSDEFFAGYEALRLPEIDLAFIDGNPAFEEVRHDFLALLRHSRRNTYVLLHDTNIYLRKLVRHACVKRWMKRLAQRKDLFEIVDFPFSSGVILGRKAWESLAPAATRS